MTTLTKTLAYVIIDHVSQTVIGVTMPSAFSGHQFVIRKGIVRTDQMNLQELVKLLVPVQILTIFDAKMENVSITAMFVMVKMSGKLKKLRFKKHTFFLNN